MILQSIATFLSANVPFASSPGIIILCICASSLLAWRLYRFTIVPLLYPDLVKELPYWIPGIGHTISLFVNAPAVVDAGVKMAGDCGEPFAVKLLGKTDYFITQPRDISQAFRNLTTLSFERFLDDHICCFGVKKEDITAINANRVKLDRSLSEHTTYPSEGHDVKEFIKWVYRRQLAADKYPEIWQVFFQAVQETSDFEQLQVKHPNGKGNGTVFMELRDLLSDTLSFSITKMLFGAKLLEIEPNMLQYTHAFIDGLWKLVYRYPEWAASEVYHQRGLALAALERFADTLDPATSDVCYLFRTVIEGQPQGKICSQSNAAFLAIMYLAALTNVHATSYWLLSYILTIPDLKAAIEAEIAPAFSNGIMDAYYVAEHCPLLDSAFREVLRLHITSTTVRYIEEPTVFQNKTLAPGSRLMFPLRQLNHSPSIWGNDHDSFDPARFVKNKNLASHTAFRPFGGGLNLCPGMAYAARQVLSYVAYMLYTFDMRLPERNGEAQPLPLNDCEKLAFGVSTPKKGTDLFVELRPSNNTPVTGATMVIPGAPEYKS